MSLPWFAYLIISSGSSVQSLLSFCGYHAVPNFFCATQIHWSCHLHATVDQIYWGVRGFLSQPGTCDVDVVLLARYASRAIDMKKATRKLTAHEMPRMPMVKTTASMKEFPRQHIFSKCIRIARTLTSLKTSRNPSGRVQLLALQNPTVLQQLEPTRKTTA